MDENRLEKALKDSWCLETSSTPSEWSEENPSRGQCAVTALVLQDYLGGKIVQSDVTWPDGTVESHYFNSIGGRQLDLTRQQFPEDADIPVGMPKKKGFDSTRAYVLSNEKTIKIYELLKKRVEESLS